ncbi:MAG: hypothetical protein HFJ80_04225 [Clostridiales bacterium]|nr:hypothetical protein [Clostridiales bacterium]
MTKWQRLHRAWTLFLVNQVLCGTHCFEIKRKLLISIGFQIGGRIAAPVHCSGTLIMGKNCWIGKNLVVNGNGTVPLGDCVDIGPEVSFNTGDMRLEQQSGEREREKATISG